MDTDLFVNNIVAAYTDDQGEVHRYAHIVYGSMNDRMAKLIGLGLLFEQAWCPGEEKIIISLNDSIVYETE